MSKIYYPSTIFVLLILFISCKSTTQIGKFYTPEEAKKLFGGVIFKVDINKDLLSALLKKTEKNIMFGLINRQLIILGSDRKLIYPENAAYNDNDVFTFYSTELVSELISNKALIKDSNNVPENISVEQRREVLSISTDAQTLESGTKCPPFCPD